MTAIVFPGAGSGLEDTTYRVALRRGTSLCNISDLLNREHDTTLGFYTLGPYSQEEPLLQAERTQ